jgi:transcriptional regulator with AAA-type ATPase domain
VETETSHSETQSAAARADHRVGLLWVFPSEQPRFEEVTEPLVVGRSPNCDIVVQAEKVSRRHLLVRRNGPILVAEDLGSRNGTYVDSARIEKSGLQHGSVLRVGESIALCWNAPISAAWTFSELLPGMFGGPALASRLPELRRAATSDLPVIVEGESGSGKEGTAAAIHRISGRKGAFIAVNCATISERLAESQLFGHRKGAFTGADRNASGYFAAAHGGTLFLDEIVDLSLEVQAKLLRVLQEREYVPLGEVRPVPVDVRMVVSANRRLDEHVRSGAFRADLYARLNGYTARLPALRERREDIAFLFRHFLAEQFGGTPPALKARLLECLCRHDWPLNVRELQMLAKRLAVLHGAQSRLGHEQLPPEYRNEYYEPALSTAAAAQADNKNASLKAALLESGGNVVRAAQKLGISRAQAYRTISQSKIDVDEYRRPAIADDGDEPS